LRHRFVVVRLARLLLFSRLESTYSLQSREGEKMRRAIIIGGILALAAAGMTSAGVLGSDHDLKGNLTTSQQVCVFCHTPHQATGVTTDPLWNHVETTNATYGTYTSGTFDATESIAEIGGTGSTSLLCMSCHDGTVGLGELYNNPNIATGEETPASPTTPISGSALLGTDLTNDHPVNFDYKNSDAGDDEIEPLANVPAGWLDANDFVQCSSCHDPHAGGTDSGDVNVDFMNASLQDSALCTNCHIK
jgi:hypothetical protein